MNSKDLTVAAPSSGTTSKTTALHHYRGLNWRKAASMKGTTKQTVGTLVGTLGVVTVFNSFKFHMVDPFWLGGAITILGVALGVLGWKLIARGRSDVALEAARHNDDQVARHQAYLAGEGPDTRQHDSAPEHVSEKKSSLEDPPDQR